MAFANLNPPEKLLLGYFTYLTASVMVVPLDGRQRLVRHGHLPERAIVTDVAGTTRDLVSEPIDLEGLAITLVDTAGWRETGERIEREGCAEGAAAAAVRAVLSPSACARPRTRCRPRGWRRLW